MAFVPVATYLALKNDTQRAALAKLNIVTLQDLFNAVWIPSKRLPRVSSRIHVLKGRLLRFLNSHVYDTFIDLYALKRAGLIQLGGRYPDQYVALIIPDSHKKVRTVAPPAPRPRPIDNGGVSNEQALVYAIRESLRLSKPAPPELCCPITLEPFRDPVSTIRGTTYERSAIVD